MNEQIKAGAEIHAGDGGYSEGTREAYEAFVKERNYHLALRKYHVTNTNNPIDFPPPDTDIEDKLNEDDL